MRVTAVTTVNSAKRKVFMAEVLTGWRRTCSTAWEASRNKRKPTIGKGCFYNKEGKRIEGFVVLRQDETKRDTSVRALVGRAPLGNSHMGSATRASPTRRQQLHLLPKIDNNDHCPSHY